MHVHYGPHGLSRGCALVLHANSSTLALWEKRNERYRPVHCTAHSQGQNIRAPAPDQVENPVCRFPAWPHGRSLLYVGRLHQSPGGEVWLDDGDVGAPLPVSYTHLTLPTIYSV